MTLLVEWIHLPAGDWLASCPHEPGWHHHTDPYPSGQLYSEADRGEAEKSLKRYHSRDLSFSHRVLFAREEAA